MLSLDLEGTYPVLESIITNPNRSLDESYTLSNGGICTPSSPRAQDEISKEYAHGVLHSKYSGSRIPCSFTHDPNSFSAACLRTAQLSFALRVGECAYETLL